MHFRRWNSCAREEERSTGFFPLDVEKLTPFVYSASILDERFASSCCGDGWSRTQSDDVVCRATERSTRCSAVDCMCIVAEIGPEVWHWGWRGSGTIFRGCWSWLSSQGWSAVFRGG